MRFISSFILTGLLLSGVSNAQENLENPIAVHQQIAGTPAREFLNENIQDKVKLALGNAYSTFYSNLEELGAPYKLKDGGMYYEGWRSYQHGRLTSAAVVYQNGTVYSVYVDPTTQKLNYASSASTCGNTASKALKVFVAQLDPIFVKNKKEFLNNTQLNCPTSSSSSFKVTPYTVSSDSPAQAQARADAASICGSTLADGWDMNDAVGDVLGQTITQINQCSANFNLVPKPPAYFSVPGLLYFAQYGYKVIAYNTALSGQNTYKACISAAALNYRSAIEMASLGI